MALLLVWRNCIEELGRGVVWVNDSKYENDNNSVFYIKNINNTCKVDAHIFSFNEYPALQLVE
jgi:hypothetical protein